MEKNEKERVYQAIRNHGNECWNATDSLEMCDVPAEGPNGESWNGYLFDELLDILEQDGLDLKLVRKGET